MNINLRNVTKYFPANGVQALSGASFELRSGEIHALVGENGAGKSTLMHILAGQLEMTTGELLVDGGPRNFHSPRDALQAGIGMVRQHPVLVPGFTCWEDAQLGLPGPGLAPLNRRLGRLHFQELSDRWGFEIDATARTETLTISQRQKVAILTLLMHRVSCIILDEPTAVLTPVETERLFNLLRKLRSEGRAIVLISHKLEETLSVADRITVLRQGKTAATRLSSETSTEELTALMFGDAVDRIHPEKVKEFQLELLSEPGLSYRKVQSAEGGPLFMVEHVSVHQKDMANLRDLSFSVFPGEVYGVAGVRDSGLEPLDHTVTGFISPQGGHITLKGTHLEGKGPLAFRKAGGAYVSADRLGKALALKLPIIDSLIVHSHRRFTLRCMHNAWFLPRLLDSKAIRRWAGELLRMSGIEGRLDSPAEAFSGGQLQRLILTREFAEEAPHLVLAEPGWGVDAVGRTLLKDRLTAYLQRGGTVLLFSTDVDELLSLATRLMVLRDGRNVLEVDVPLDPVQRHLLKPQISAAMVGSDAVKQERQEDLL